jgi:hypothetical protein
VQQEGVIKFEIVHRDQSLDDRRLGELACKVIAWREIMALTGLVGQDPSRYEGAGYGNVSARLGPPVDALGHRSFLITGTQTAGKRAIGLADFAVVERYDFPANRVESQGLVRPSSESMTHAALYDAGPQIRCVLHAHSRRSNGSTARPSYPSAGSWPWVATTTASSSLAAHLKRPGKYS